MINYHILIHNFILGKFSGNNFIFYLFFLFNPNFINLEPKQSNFYFSIIIYIFYINIIYFLKVNKIFYLMISIYLLNINEISNYLTVKIYLFLNFQWREFHSYLVYSFYKNVSILYSFQVRIYI
jgi:hypothetical protein